jgi:hypothetical protein
MMIGRFKNCILLFFRVVFFPVFLNKILLHTPFLLLALSSSIIVLINSLHYTMLGQNQIETAGETDKPPLCRHHYSWVHPALELRRSINGWGLFVKERYQFQSTIEFSHRNPTFCHKM